MSSEKYRKTAADKNTAEPAARDDRRMPSLCIRGIGRGWVALAQSRMSPAQGPRHFLDYGA
jgi:hypothetical protein